MSEVSAAMGLTSLQSCQAFLDANRRNHRLYQQGIARLPGLSLIRYDDREECNRQYIVVEVDAQLTELHRDLFIQVLHAENVLARRYFWPGCHRQEPYRTLFPEAHRYLPHTEWVAERVLVLPTGTTVGEREIGIICELLAAAVANATAIRQRVPA
jgi:dTDP-4-amino-4,6-dideoxygalactose transaminase